MVGKGCSCGTLNYPEGNICLYMYKTFLKRDIPYTCIIFRFNFSVFLMPTMINLVVFNHSPKFESITQSTRKIQGFALKSG